MTFSLPNDQKFIKSVILYEVNNWTPIDKICENLRKLVGNGLIPKSCSFPELSVESLTELVKDMDVKDVDSIQKDQKFIRSVIFYENHIGKEKEDIYKKLCRNIGEDSIDYQMFSHWFDQFKNGDYYNFPKSHTFSELPVDVINIVVKKLELNEQLSLRKVSRSFRLIVDSQKPAYKNIVFTSYPNHAHVEFNDKNVMYCDTGFDVPAHYCNSSLKSIKIIETNDYINIAFSDVTIALKNPKLQLESLQFYHDTNNYSNGYENAAIIYEKMGNLLKTLNHKISVNMLVMMTEQDNHVLAILPYLKPGVLDIILLFENKIGPSTDFNIDKIVTLDQWKQAKTVTIETLISTPIENFLHLNYFTVQLNPISIKDLILIRDVLLPSSEFQNCKLISARMLSFAEIDQVFDLKEHVSSYGSNYGYCPIPNSHQIFHFAITEWSLTIQKTSPYES